MNRVLATAFMSIVFAVLFACVALSQGCGSGEGQGSYIAPPQDFAPSDVGADPVDDTPADEEPGTPPVDGTPVSICAGYAATAYPQTATCVNGALFVTDADNNTVWLRPGTYKARKTGAACSFRVKPGCKLEEVR